MAKLVRLSKVVKEFNVGKDTIIDFLASKGIKIDSTNINTVKLDEESYRLVSNEYSSDSETKKASEKINLKRENKESIVIDEKTRTPKKEEEKKASKKQEEISQSKEAKAEEKKSKKTTQEETKEETKDTSKKTKEEKVIKTEAPKVEQPKVLGKIDLDAPKKEKTETPKEEVKEVEVVSETPKEELIKEEAETPKEEVTEKKTSEKETSTKKSDEVEDDNGEIKVVGKIDLSSLNQRTRPKKKSKKEKEEEKIKRKKDKKVTATISPKNEEVSPSEKQENTEEKAPKKEEDVIFKSEVEKLEGPKVLGKIELKEEKKPSSNKKKKRKRITKEKVSPNDNNAKNKSRSNNKSEQRKKVFGKKKPVVKQEVSEEDVQKQIKETLARLTNKQKGKGAKYRRDKREAERNKAIQEIEASNKEKNILKVTEFVSVNEIATMMDVSVNEVISACMSLGLFVSINQRLDAETIALVADEFSYKVEFVSVEVQEAISQEEDTEEDLISRSPIVTVMGHVDHGKTKLLDYIRNANVVAGEAGGITQHIGAYSVQLESGEKITFLDTPGHEAFTAMRARGAQVTDVAIIVVSADDGVMPQTKEAINHAAAAGVPIIFAINKIDLPTANPDKIKEELSQLNYLVEDWGGKYQSQEISAKKGVNVDELLEKVLLESELLELKANPNKKASGSIIESELDKGRGYVSTVLVQSGTLRIGDVVLAGSYYGHVKAMFDERGNKVKEAGPSVPVQILGLNGAPPSGDNFNVMESDAEARNIANKREQLERQQSIRTQKHITLDEIGRRLAIGNFQELNVIIKGDVDGSIEALTDSLVKLSTEEIQVNVIHKAVGEISESDVMLANVSNAVIIGFQVRPSQMARKLAEKEEIEIRLYSIIYDAINDLKDAMSGMLSPEIKEEIIATVEVLETFKISKVGTIAGCIVREGKIKRSSKVRLIRQGIVIYDGELGSLKRFKDDAKEVASGYECGLNIEKYNDIKVGDIVEAYEEKEIARTL